MTRKLLFIAASGIILFSYQNFSPLSEEERRTLRMMEEMNHLESSAERSGLVTPKSGRDLASVRDSWLEQQSTVWLDGADQRFLDSINARLNTWWHEPEVATAATEEEAAAPAGTPSRGPASIPEEAPESNFRFASLNKVEYKVDDSSHMSCVVDGEGAKFDYSKSWSRNAQVGVAHSLSEQQTQFMLKYRW